MSVYSRLPDTLPLPAARVPTSGMGRTFPAGYASIRVKPGETSQSAFAPKGPAAGSPRLGIDLLGDIIHGYIFMSSIIFDVYYFS
jgi:hypothetical protein